VVCFTAWPLHFRGRSPNNHWIGRWVWPIALLDTLEKRSILTLSGIKPLFVCYPVRGPVTVLNEVFRLLKKKTYKRQHFNFQLMHTTLKNVELLEHFKISKTGTVLLILKCANNSNFFNVVCISWKLKCWILLMHGVTMKLTKGFKLVHKLKCNILVLKSNMPADHPPLHLSHQKV